MENDYLLTTERLFIRPFLPEDALGFYELNADPEVIRYTADPPFESVAAAEAFIRSYDHYQKYGYGRWAVLEQSTGQFIGFCGLKYHPELATVDLGYRLRRSHWGKGLATEAARACRDYGFDQLQLPHLIGRVQKGNAASVRVLQKIGMTFQREINLDGVPGWLYAIDRPQ